MSAVRFRDLTLGYDRHPVVRRLDGVVAEGALLAVAGPNGAGKSTLLKAVAGTLGVLGGRLALDGIARHDVAYLPQAADIDRSFPISVANLVAAGAWRRGGLFASWKSEMPAVAEALGAVGLAGFADRPIGSLSGGQLQRALFARLLLQNARLILLDEPFTAIDPKTTADLLVLVRRWHGERRTVIAVLHDLDLIRCTFPETLLLAREPVAWGKTAEVLTGENLLRARRMVDAPDPAARVAACAA